MHERITLVSDTEVVVTINTSGSQYLLTIQGDRIMPTWVKPREAGTDRPGEEACCLIGRCWLDTGSFAALGEPCGTEVTE